MTDRQGDRQTDRFQTNEQMNRGQGTMILSELVPLPLALSLNTL